jgi:cytochrome P450
MATGVRPAVSVPRAEINSAAFAENPWDSYRRWRNESGVHQVKRTGEWLVLNHASVSFILREHALFSSSPMAEFSTVLNGSDPPVHTEMRKALQPLFDRKLQLARRDAVQEITRRRIDQLKQRASFEMVDDFTAPVTHSIACGWLGVREDRTAPIKAKQVREVRWADVEPALEADGPVARIAAAFELDRNAIAELVAFLLVAGVETVRELVAFSLLAISRDADCADRLLTNATTIPDILEELIRLEPSVHTLLRRTTDDVEIEGRVIPRGSIVWASLAAANRDPLKFTDPDSIVAGRDATHVSFGSGQHFCPGRYLGRVEAEVILVELIPYFRALLERSTRPAMRFSGPNASPALRQMASWKLSFGRNA